MLYKPRGYITTLSDERGRRTAASLVDCGTRVYPVGRLDYDSEGLLLFTNDGALADRLMHPRREISKVYEVTARGPLDGAAERLRRPLVLDGYRIRPPEVEQTAPGRFLITIHEGRNRQIRRMCAAAGLEVQRDRCSSERSRPAHGVRSPKRSLPRCGRKQKGEILYDGRHPDEHT